MIDGRLRVGVQLPEVERDVRWPELRAIARTAEASGYDSIWVGDHMLYRGDARPERGPWDAWSMLAALAASTERVRLGPLVASTAFHPPGLVARMAAAIDEVSAGRFTLGVGTGWNEAEFRAFGIAFENKVARFEEAFTIIRRLLAGERVSFDGRFYRSMTLCSCRGQSAACHYSSVVPGRGCSRRRRLTSTGGTVGTRGTATRRRGSQR